MSDAPASSTTVPVAPADLAALEAAFAAPAVEPAHRTDHHATLLRDPRAAQVADSARLAPGVTERLAIALFAVVLAAGLALVVLAVFG